MISSTNFPGKGMFQRFAANLPEKCEFLTFMNHCQGSFEISLIIPKNYGQLQKVKSDLAINTLS